MPGDTIPAKLGNAFKIEPWPRNRLQSLIPILERFNEYEYLAFEDIIEIPITKFKDGDRIVEFASPGKLVSFKIVRDFPDRFSQRPSVFDTGKIQVFTLAHDEPSDPLGLNAMYREHAEYNKGIYVIRINSLSTATPEVVTQFNIRRNVHRAPIRPGAPVNAQTQGKSTNPSDLDASTLRASEEAGYGGKLDINDISCPITQEIMHDPVVASDGHTYERAAIEKWLQSSKRSPVAGFDLSNKKLIPNHALKKIIDRMRPATTHKKISPDT
ncbi:MAG TPA: U-box domain-containing protein [Gammaproteobacteria bacterium]|nr:U-box domain-containing protein [Gammaproteobacteria bacterium]